MSEVKKTESTALTVGKSYDVEFVNPRTGEVVTEAPMYIEGRPREYRFNGQNGQFNLFGDKVLTDKSGRGLSSFTFHPMAYRTFEDQLFGRDRREQWAELFFIDEDGAVSQIMFNNTSVQELYRMLEPLLYERKSLSDVIITAKAERVQSKNDPTKSWFLCRFSYDPAPLDRVDAAADFVRDYKVYRQETITPACENKLISDGYYQAEPLSHEG